jgi:uncharacterized cupin superfamily protein
MRIIDHKQQPTEDWMPGISTCMRISAQTGAAQLTVFEQWIAPGLSVPSHWHPVKEIVSVIDGEAEVSLKDQSAIRGPIHLGSAQSATRLPQLRIEASAYALHACRPVLRSDLRR